MPIARVDADLFADDDDGANKPGKTDPVQNSPRAKAHRSESKLINALPVATSRTWPHPAIPQAANTPAAPTPVRNNIASSASPVSPSTAVPQVLAPSSAALRRIAGARDPKRPQEGDVAIFVHGGNRAFSKQQAALLQQALRARGARVAPSATTLVVVSACESLSRLTSDCETELQKQETMNRLHRQPVDNALATAVNLMRSDGCTSIIVRPDWGQACLTAGEDLPALPALEKARSQETALRASEREPSTSPSQPARQRSSSLSIPTNKATAVSHRGVTLEDGADLLPGAAKAGYVPVFFSGDARESDARRRVTTSVRSGEASAEWRPFDAVDASAPATPAQSPFLSERQLRVAAMLDERKPFACQKPAGDDEVRAANPNEGLLQHLSQLMDVYRASGDKWREYAYNKAVAQIKKLPRPVQSIDDVRHIPGLGDRIRNKIEEYLATGTTKKLEYLVATPEVAALQQLTKIWGVGPTTARKLYHSGVQSVEDLRNRPNLGDLLNPAQLVGLKHYEDLQVRIPRAEVALIERIVCEALLHMKFAVHQPDAEEQAVPTAVAVASAPSTHGADKSRQLDVVTCGSYRRGKSTSGDVDVLLCDRTGRLSDGVLALLVDELQKLSRADSSSALSFGKRFDLMDQLTHGMRSHEETHHDTWFGVVRVAPCDGAAACPCTHGPNGEHLARRLDLKLYPAAYYPFAILYFTGSDYFNRSMRLYAQKKGFTLSDRELRPAMRVKGDKVHEGLPVPCATERDIFTALGLPYKSPSQRDIS